jgi:hypothetical protein
MLQQLGTPLKDVTLAMLTSPPDRDEFAIIFTILLQTVDREIRSGEYDGDDIITICSIARKYGFHLAGSFSDMLEELEGIWTKVASKPVIENVVAAFDKLAVGRNPQ